MPPVPTAAAVYKVVAIGLTTWVPPLDWRAYVMPSDPVTVTVVAFTAVTVRVDELPEVIEEGEAEIPKVGPPDVEVALPPQPANSSGSKRLGIIQERIERRDLHTRVIVMVFTFLSLQGESASPVLDLQRTLLFIG
jgi:hypothetical protein